MTKSKRHARSCQDLTERESVFVETILVLALHKSDLGELGSDQVLRMTYDQIREVAEARHPHIRWGCAGTESDEKRDNTELKRQKKKWVDRLGKPS
ncbi:MAG: hypothetical protein ACXVAT_19570, partial [Isosphaeraceae bacterium]